MGGDGAKTWKFHADLFTANLRPPCAAPAVPDMLVMLANCPNYVIMNTLIKRHRREEVPRNM